MVINHLLIGMILQVRILDPPMEGWMNLYDAGVFRSSKSPGLWGFNDLEGLGYRRKLFRKSLGSQFFIQEMVGNHQTSIQKMVALGDEKNNCKPTLLKTNSLHLKLVVSNRNLLFQGSIFRCELLVLGRVVNPWDSNHHSNNWVFFL